MRRTTHHLTNERGIALPAAAVAMVAILGLTTVGVETGRLALTATEVQNAADVAASSAANAVVDGDDPKSAALSVLARNSIDGRSVGSSQLKSLEIGNYTTETEFVADLLPYNAARATVEYTVDNVIAAAIGMPTSTVTKTAIAAFQANSSGTPTLPIVVGDCLFDTSCLDDLCLPHLGLVPSPIDNSAWTGFFENASVSDITPYFPSECGGSDQSVELELGDMINVTNGDLNALLKKVECLVDNGMTKHTVAVVECGLNLTQSKAVVGFATIEITSVRTTGFNQGITLETIVEVTEPPTGGTNYGSGAIILVG
jgi:hypothetical protein